MRITEWMGYDKVGFMLDGKEGFVVLPQRFAEGRPWVWRTEFFDHYDNADTALLEAGYCRAYYRQSDLYGCPEAVEGMRRFHEFVTRVFGLAGKAALVGLSRGGLYACQFAAACPERVALLYLDAPVLDIRSWPGGKGTGIGAAREWQECLAAYGLTEEASETAGVSPLDRIGPIANARIPILMIAGDADSVVPYSENGAILEERYRGLGGRIETIVKPGVGHHPHGLEEPGPILAFVRSVYPAKTCILSGGNPAL
ncbi:alpha/beta fold hydrolase [Cohnella fermenti]|uniref:Alpha/beta hydrolase n=1 Tax=Cohnella fermenti TaxID=2565925 RepID=A0A4S4BL68_9BACL|nr:alpha/beta hydrolase [Cohnella fermenti]THF73007.1 alpha/beta hydrolase [Cohnella fermenti]